MHKLYIRQKVFSFGDKYAIMDDQGNPVYYAQGKIFSFGAQITITDTMEYERAFIKQELFHMMPRYVIYENGQPMANLRMRFRLLGARVDIETPHGEYTVEGKVLQHEFNVFHQQREVIQITKQWLTFGDCYEIAFDDGISPVFAVALVVAIDNAYHNQNNR